MRRHYIYLFFSFVVWKAAILISAKYTLKLFHYIALLSCLVNSEFSLFKFLAANVKHSFILLCSSVWAESVEHANL